MKERHAADGTKKADFRWPEVLKADADFQKGVTGDEKQH